MFAIKRIRQPEDERLQNPIDHDISSRRIVKAPRSDRKTEFVRHVTTLNHSLQDWFRNQIKQNDFVDLTTAAQDYKDYATDIEDRYLRKYGEVLTFGSGDCGQLAHGVDRDEDMMVKYPRIVYPLRGKKVIGIACGGLHNAVYTEQGQVFTWGCADDGSLGREGDESTPLLVDTLNHETIIGVSCGDGQTIAMTATGEVYGWGCFKDKEGKKWFTPEIHSSNPLKEMKNQKNIPMKIPQLNHIVEISSGSSFCLARTSTGFAYSWGISECGELGRTAPSLKIKGVNSDGEEDMVYDLKNILKYHLIPDKMHKMISYSHNISGYTSASASSSNNTGNSINNSSSSSSSSNSSIPIDNVKSIGSGSYHSFVITAVGNTIYSCGLNNYSQLGHGDLETRYVLEEINQLNGKDIIIAKGGVHHSIVLSNHGQLYAFGRGDSGQLGVKEMEGKAAGAYSTIPYQVQLSSIKSTSFHTSTNTTNNNTAATSSTATINNSNDRVIGIACGGNHNLVLTSANEIYSWGYGDMLSLGHGEEKDETSPRKINLAKSKVGNIAVTQVAGGGQHSAIIGEVTI